jgi:hypothetical protein
MAQIQAGAPIVFARKLRLAPAGIVQNRNFMRWSEIGRVDHHPFRLELYRLDGRLGMWIDTVNLPNAHLFAPVLDLYKSLWEIRPVSAEEVELSQAEATAWDFHGVLKVISDSLLGIGLAAFFGLIIGGIIGQMVGMIIEIGPEVVLGFFGAGLLIGVIVAIIIQMELLSQKIRSSIIFAALGIAAGAIFGFLAMRISSLMFSELVSVPVGLLAGVGMGMVVGFNLFDHPLGQMVFRLVMAFISAMLFGWLGAALVGLVVGNVIGSIMGIIVGVVIVRQMFKLPFARLLQTLSE